MAGVPESDPPRVGAAQPLGLDIRPYNLIIVPTPSCPAQVTTTIVARMDSLRPDRVACRRRLVCHWPTDPRLVNNAKRARHMRTAYAILIERLEENNHVRTNSSAYLTGAQPHSGSERLPEPSVALDLLAEPPLGQCMFRTGPPLALAILTAME